MQFYRQYAPNFITAITYKTLSQKLKETLPLNQHFCRIGTYCKVSYKRGHISLTGLYRLNIEEVQKLDIADDISIPPEILSVPERLDVGPALPIFQERRNKVLELLMRNEEEKQKDKTPDEFYLSRVTRLVEPPLLLNTELQAKVRFLVSSYFKLFNKDVTANNVNLLDAVTLVDAIASQLSQRQYVSAEQFQQLIGILDIGERIDKVQSILNKSSSFTVHLEQLEKITQQRFRQKKLYEYYSEICNIAKQTIDGKQAK